MQIGDKLKLARENKGLSREHLAAIADMDVRTYEKIENNKRDPHLSEIEKFSKALEISAAELLFGEPRLVFENCNQPLGYNTGTVYYQSIEEIKTVYEKLIKAKDEIIEEKDKIIELLKNKK